MKYRATLCISGNNTRKSKNRTGSRVCLKMKMIPFADKGRSKSCRTLSILRYSYTFIILLLSREFRAVCIEIGFGLAINFNNNNNNNYY